MKIIVANDCVFPEDWTVNDLMESHRSRQYNPLIANAFFRAGFIEAWGRGIQKIKDSCAEAGNPMPEYTVKREDIMVMFQNMTRDTTQGVTQTDIQTCENSIPMRIITVIKENPALSQRQIAQMLGEKLDTIKYHMRKMRLSGTTSHQRPQHCLYFLPLPHGQGSLRPTLRFSLWMVPEFFCSLYNSLRRSSVRISSHWGRV